MFPMAPCPCRFYSWNLCDDLSRTYYLLPQLFKFFTETVVHFYHYLHRRFCRKLNALHALHHLLMELLQTGNPLLKVAGNRRIDFRTRLGRSRGFLCHSERTQAER